MPEWLSHAITSVLTAIISSGIVVKVLAWRYQTRLANQATELAQQAGQRETRKDEIDVLHTTIDQARKDLEAKELERTADRKYYEARDLRREKEMREMKDQHTACMVRTEGMEKENAHLAERARELDDRNKALEAEIGRLRGNDT
jgi:septal ring factor EnvC (AmiA/AmiB activator)